MIEVRGQILTLRELDSQKVFMASHDSVRVSTLSQPEVPQPVDPLTDSQNSQRLELTAEDSEIGRVDNLQLFADDELLPPASSQPPSLLDLELTPPPALL